MTRSSDRAFDDSTLDALRSATRLQGAPDKAAAYARFIPREELRSFAAWNPRPLSGESVPPIHSGVQRPKAAAEPKKAEPRAPDPDVAALVRAARQAGYQDGYRDGLVALEAFKQSFMNQMTGQLGVLNAAFQGQLDEVQQKMSEALVRTATQIARQVVRSELSSRPELIAVVVQEALGVLLSSARHVTLRVHPDDMATVASGAGEALAARGARLVPDASVARGGCIVDSDLGTVDASVETRWRRAAEQIGHRGAYDEQVASACMAQESGIARPAAPEEKS